MVNAVNAWHPGILNEAGRNNSAKSGGQKFENLPPLGAIFVHGSCKPVWHSQSQDAKIDGQLHGENPPLNPIMILPASIGHETIY
jgi:hypothetical protein